MGNTLFTVVGGQFGSEAKGHFAASLAAREVHYGHRVIAIRVAGPNAGHTAYDKGGTPFALRTIPAMAVVDPSVQLVIAAGSEVEYSVLKEEVEMLEAAGHLVRHRLFIDSQATILTDEHHRAESPEGLDLHSRLGSTGKGIGAARSDRLLRKAAIIAQQKPLYQEFGSVIDTVRYMRGFHNTSFIIEGTQGYGLGLHAGFYPYCTSSDCRAIDFQAMAGVHPGSDFINMHRTFIVMRTYPIRVAGNSGPLYEEVSWDDLAEQSGGYIQPERTTVTKKIRRIGRWDGLLAQMATQANGRKYSSIALSFLDYIDPTIANTGAMSSKAWDFVMRVQNDTGTRVDWAATGPDTEVWL